MRNFIHIFSLHWLCIGAVRSVFGRDDDSDYRYEKLEDLLVDMKLKRADRTLSVLQRAVELFAPIQTILYFVEYANFNKECLRFCLDTAILANNTAFIDYLVEAAIVNSSHVLSKADDIGMYDVRDWAAEKLCRRPPLYKSMIDAIWSGKLSLVILAEANGYNDWNMCLCEAAKAGSIDSFEYCITRGATALNRAMAYAAMYNRTEMIRKYMEEGVVDINESLIYAAKLGSDHSIDVLCGLDIGITPQAVLRAGDAARKSGYLTTSEFLTGEMWSRVINQSADPTVREWEWMWDTSYLIPSRDPQHTISVRRVV